MILLMGLAGSGKGTQGKLLSQQLDYEYMSTGEYLREYLSENRKEQILAGELIDDQEMIQIIDDFINQTKKDSILDGFPRSPVQSEWLLKKHLAGTVSIEAVIYLIVDKTELVERLVDRGRADDTETAIKTRFDEYSRSTLPIIDKYKKAGIKIVEVDGSGKMEDINQKINESLNS